MPRATCRCGQVIRIPKDGGDHVVCPGCNSKIRVRLKPKTPGAGVGDGYVRFLCPCGRRLKVVADASKRPSHGKCPDCSRIVPVPADADAGLPQHQETPTEDLSPTDLERLERWAQTHKSKTREPLGASVVATAASAKPAKSIEEGPSVEADTVWPSEAGLRLCPRCAIPVPMGASSCQECGAAVPRR